LNPNPSGNGLTLNISLTDNSLDLELAMEVRSFFRLTDKREMEIIERVKMEVKNWQRIAENVRISRQEQEMMSQAFFD